MPSTPLISVILPAYNAENTITDAMQSILSGSFSELELIVINDGSTDTTKPIVESFNDSRVSLIDHPDAGVAAANNEGVRQAKAPLIARMDADDIAHPDRLHLQLEMLERNCLDIVGSRVEIVDHQGASVPSLDRYKQWINQHISTEDILAFRFVESPLVHPTTLAKREVWELGCRQGSFPEDYDLWLRAFEKGYKPAKHPDVLLTWRDRPSRLTRINESFTPEAFDRCRKEHLLSGPLKGITEIDFWGVGRTGKPWIRWLISEGFKIRHLIDVSRKKIGQQIHGATVITPEDMPHSTGVPLLVAVGTKGIRELILQHLNTTGHTAGKDAWFLC